MGLSIDLDSKSNIKENFIEAQVTSIAVENSYEYSKKVTKQYAKSFYFATQLLPAEKRRATYALYGFCRYTDNLVDDNTHLSETELRYKVQTWKFDLELALSLGYSHNPILNAFTDLLKNYNININDAYELIKGIEMDISINRYESYQDLKVFCYRVASVVGIMMSEILGYDNKLALEYAKDLGEAMQITNILRDINEDLEMDRIYIPKELMKKNNYSEEDLKNKINNDAFKNLMEDLMQRAEILYKKADIGIGMLDKNSRFAIAAASRIYGGIIPKIREANYDVFSQRIFVSKKKKILLMCKEFIKNLV